MGEEVGNKILVNAIQFIRKKRPKVPEDLNYTLWIEHRNEQPFVQLWFRTIGCRNSFLGSCTMCDYWMSDPVSPQQMVNSVKQGLDEINGEPSFLLINSSGSVFDDWEVPLLARQEIFKLLSRFKETKFIFETRAETISREKISECKKILQAKNISIEMGLESADPWILKHCINKALDLNDIYKAIKILNLCGVESIFNVLIGTPFLTFSEMVNDAVSSVNWILNQGADQCVLFPINIKPWTLVYWLEEQGLYNLPSLWALVDVLMKIDPEFLPRVHLSWYKSQPQFHPKYETSNRSPKTCPRCYSKVLHLLDEYSSSNNRIGIVQQLEQISCNCKILWSQQLNIKPELSLRKRVYAIYEVINEQIINK